MIALKALLNKKLVNVFSVFKEDTWKLNTLSSTSAFYILM